jgi:hypothetical protein
MRVKNTDNKEHVEDNAVPVPLPEWEKERERETRDKDRSRTSSEGRDEKTVRDSRDTGSDFRQLTQVCLLTKGMCKYTRLRPWMDVAWLLGMVPLSIYLH